MITAVIIDDDITAQEVLQTKLESYEDIRILGTEATGADGLRRVVTERPDVVFLDIQLTDISGLDLLRQMAVEGVKSKIVIYTAFDQYMLPSFRSHAFDFLLKPIDDNDLDNIILRLRGKSITDGKIARPGSGEQPNQMRRENDCLLVYVNAVDFHTVSLRDIVLFTYVSEYRSWEIHATTLPHPVRLRRSIGRDAITALGDQFVQMNQHHIVNINFVMKVINNRCYFYPPFDAIDYVTVSSIYRKKLTRRFINL